MTYRISARYPGRGVTFTLATEEEALAKCDELVADGIDFDMTDSEGVSVDEVDLEERIEARGEG
ncbi:hypothetical protein [Phenylobacterium sp.]|uniref:hypothetical protein n=1 Tax=Phenylobacterium sp. TaxID=1871053 RepID=UPI003BACA972